MKDDYGRGVLRSARARALVSVGRGLRGAVWFGCGVLVVVEGGRRRGADCTGSMKKNKSDLR